MLEDVEEEDDTSDWSSVDSDSESEGASDADDEMSGQEENQFEDMLGHTEHWQRLSHWVQAEVRNTYANCYEASREHIPRVEGESQLHHLLTTLKHKCPDEFRADLCVTPSTFDALLNKIFDDPIFTNNSSNPQLPVDIQLSITLYRFGHDGNASGLRSTSKWAGVGKGTVHDCTRHVMTAILQPQFMKSVVRWPTEAEKEEAKMWIEKHSCKAWRNGWLMVDGTLVPLIGQPTWYGESYFDRKCRYSLNIQASV